MARTRLGHSCSIPCAPGHPKNACALFGVDEKIERGNIGVRERCFGLKPMSASEVRPTFSHISKGWDF